MATSEQMNTIRARAVNVVSREMMEEGVNLSHAQADEIGADGLDWLAQRLGLSVQETCDGVECSPADDDGEAEVD